MAEADGELLGAFASTLRAVFGKNVYGMRLPRTGGNFLVVARKGRPLERATLTAVAAAAATHAEQAALQVCSWQLQRGLQPLDRSGPVLTDDRSPVEILTERDWAAMRRRALEAAR